MTHRRDREALYSKRKLSQGYPGLDRLALEWFAPHLAAGDDPAKIERLLTYLGRLVDLGAGQKVLVVGCGPRPQTVRVLHARGMAVLGVEPVPAFVASAREYVGDTALVIEGSAERIPVEDGSQQLVLCESILEHVDSPLKSLTEIHRVLAPGGAVYVSTTNRYRLALDGGNGEFNVRFFNWLPALVKESFVFQHLHYRPELANFSERPAVHWYSYAELCRLGREAGFASFYSLIDLLDASDDAVRRSRIRAAVLDRIKHNPWLRSLALIQLGGSIAMLKRYA